MTKRASTLIVLQSVEQKLLGAGMFDRALEVSELVVIAAGVPLPETVPPEPPTAESEVLALCAEVGPLVEKKKKRVRRKVKLSEIKLGEVLHDLEPEPEPELPGELPIQDQNVQDAIGARTLLQEVMKRATYDWVLYRNSTKLEQKALADDAYTWLFQEEPGHHYANVRKSEGKSLTSFLSICDVFDVDPEVLRRKFKLLTIERVLSFGRPPSAPTEEDSSEGHRSFVDLPPETEGFFGSGEE